MIWWSPDYSTIPHLSPQHLHESLHVIGVNDVGVNGHDALTQTCGFFAGFIILPTPKMGVPFMTPIFLWYFAGVNGFPIFCRGVMMKLPTTPKKRWCTMKNGSDDFLTFTSKLQNRGHEKNGTHFFREDCPCDFCKSKWCHEFRKNSPLNSHVGVSKNRGTPKWMVYNGKAY